jgi:hypothetical protein
MHSIQFVSTMMVIQMKVMQVNGNLKNMMIQEFQHFVESQLTQVSRIKMQMVQFASMMTVIRKKLIKVIGNLKNMMNKEFQLNME